MIRLFDKKEYVEEKFADVNVRMKKYGQDAVFFSALINPSTRFINAIIYLAVAALGAYIVIQGNNPVVLGISMTSLTVGGLSCTLSYANQYTKPFNEITGVITEVADCAQRSQTSVRPAGRKRTARRKSIALSRKRLRRYGFFFRLFQLRSLTPAYRKL